MKFLSHIIFSIIDQVLNSEMTEKIATIGGGAAASLFAFVDTGFSSFIFKCLTAAVFASIGAATGYFTKKMCQKVFNKYFQNDKKQQNHEIRLPFN